MNLIGTEDIAQIAVKWGHGEGTLDEDLLNWGIDPDAWREAATKYVAMSMVELIQENELTFTACIREGFIGGFQLGYLCALEAEMRR